MAITGVGTNQTFNYTGGVQTFTAPYSGTYKLEVWGAQGGSVQDKYNPSIVGTGGKGGYSYGSVNLNKGDTLYICVGGQGSIRNTPGSGDNYGNAAGGYNGGGNGWVRDASADGNVPAAGGGGGATHIGKTNATLVNTTSTNVLIVAGGGGGGAIGQLSNGCNGGAGGGTATAGVVGIYGDMSGSAGAVNGGSYGLGQSSNSVITLGQSTAGGGGGGGYRGGGCGGATLYATGGSGAGGTGYVGGVSNGATSNGSRTGNGQAIITLTKLSTLFYYNGTGIEKLIFNGTNITSLNYNNTKIF